MEKLNSLRSAAAFYGFSQATYRRAWIRIGRPGIVAGGAILLNLKQSEWVASEASRKPLGGKQAICKKSR